jgi:hypothetical protein
VLQVVAVLGGLRRRRLTQAQARRKPRPPIPFAGAMYELDRLFRAGRKRRQQLEQQKALQLAAMSPPLPKWGGFVHGHKVIYRDREGAWNELKRRYFDENPLFDDATFHRRYEISFKRRNVLCVITSPSV